MGAPQNPVDGTKYAELLLGVPMVLEFDSSTGGFKLVVDVEGALEVTMTGVVIDVGSVSTIANWQLPAQYPEDSLFVGGITGSLVLGVRTDRMQSYVSDDGDLATLNLDSLGRLYTWTTGSYTFADTELPAAAAAADGYANPTAPSVLAHMMGYNGATWDRLYMGISGSLSVDLITQLDAVNDEITAYITGSTSLNLGGKSITRAVINVTGIAGDELELIAAVGGQKIKVIEAMLIGNADVTISFQSGWTGTALTGPLSLPADGDGFFIGTPAQLNAHHFETVAGENLVLDIDANVLIGGWLNIVQES